jgi:hypothetical protein
VARDELKKQVEGAIKIIEVNLESAIIGSFDSRGYA